MSLNQVNVAVVDNNTIVKADVLRAEKTGAAVKIKAVKGAKYILAEGDKGLAPENITIKRVGKNLHVMLEGSEEPNLIIEDYFDNPGELVGKAEDGQWHDYISTDGDSDNDAAFLMDGESSALALGSDAIASLDGLAVAEGAISPALLALGALAGIAALAGLAAAIAHNRDKGNDNGDDNGGGVIDPPGEGGGVVVTPVVDGIADHTGHQTGDLHHGDHTDENRPVFNGTGTPGDTVIVKDGDTLIGSTVVGDDGHWTVQPVNPLPDGEHNFIIIGKDPDGNESAPTDPVTIIVDTTPPDAAKDLALDDNVGVVGPIHAGDITDDTTPTFSGTAEPGATVIVKDNGVEIGTAIVGDDGNWSFTPDPLTPGAHDFSTIVEDAAGNRSPETPGIGFTVDPTIAQVTLGAVTDNEGVITGPLVNGAVTDDDTPTLSGQATPGSIVTVFDGDTPIGSVRVGPQGEWNFTTPALGEGPHSLSVQASTGANTSPRTEPFDLTVDTTAPANPGEGQDPNDPNYSGIGQAWDDVGVVTGPIDNGGITDDSTPTFSGSNQTTGDIIIVRDGDEVLGSTVVDGNGGWQFTPPPLNDGPHPVNIIVQDPAGNQSQPSPDYVVIVDTSAPSRPAITAVMDDAGPDTGPVANGGTTDDFLPEIRGTAEAGSWVLVYDGRVLLGSTQADASGNWSFTPDSALLNGVHNIIAYARDEAGNTSFGSDPWSFTVQSGGVATAPSIGGALDDVGTDTGMLHNGDLTDDAQPTLTGTARPGDTVTVRMDGVELGTVVADAEGNWSLTPSQPLPDGTHNFTATATGPDGLESAPTGEFQLVIDTLAPDAAGDLSLSDNVGDKTGEINPGDTTDDSTPTFSGTAEPGATVIVKDNGRDIGTAIVGDDGQWSFTPDTPLEDGHHEFSTVVRDPAGNESAETPPVGFDVDTSAISVSIDYVVDDVAPQAGNLASGSVTDDATPTLHGKALANSTIVIKDENGNVLGQTQANAFGDWRFTTPALAEGQHRFTAEATSPAGNTATSAAFDLNIDLTAPGTGTGIGDVQDDVGLDQGSVENGGTTDDTTPTLIGGGLQPGDIVIIRDGGEPIGSVIADENGGWEYTTPPLNDGEHHFDIIVKDPVGHESAPSDEYVVIVDTHAPIAPAITGVLDDQGNLTGPIANGGLTDDARPEIQGTGDAGSIVLVYDQGQLLGSAQVQADGSWSFTPDSPLPNGPHSISVVGRDDAGNTTPHSAAWDFTVQAGGVPGVPTITDAWDDVAYNTGSLSSGSLTNDARPEIRGTAPAGSLVILSVDGAPVASFTADASGHWSWTPDADLGNGEHRFSATATDSVGNISAPTADFVLEIDTLAPDAAGTPALSDNVGDVQGPVADGDTTDDNTPTFSGTAEPGSTVIVSDNGRVIGEVVTQPDGSWSFTPDTPLADGPHEFSAVVRDEAGNESAPTAPIHFTVDTSAVAVSIEYAEDNAGSLQGNLASGAATDDNTPTLVGQATPNATVIIRDAAGNELGRVQATAQGRWEFETPALADGVHSLTAEVTNAAGNTVVTESFDLTIDTQGPGKPGTPGNGDGIGDVLDNVGDIQGPIANGGVTDDTTPTLVGTGLQPGDTVEVRDNGEFLGTAIVKDDGSWEFTPVPALNDGDHEFTIIVTDPVGNRSPESDPYLVVVDTQAPSLPIITEITDDQGNLTGPIANGGVTDDASPEIQGTGEAGSFVLVYDNGQYLGSTQVQTDGTWSFTPDQPLPNGAHSISVVGRDEAGNTTPHSAAWDFTLVTGGTPVVPAITDVVDDVDGGVVGTIQKGEYTNDNTPTVKGTGVDGTIIYVMNGTETLGSTTVVNGRWEFTPAAPGLVDGTYDLTAYAKDVAGNNSPETGEWQIIVDTVAPGAISDAALWDDYGAVTGEIVSGDTTDDSTPTFKGTAEPGATVIIRDAANNEVGRVTADPTTGAWGFTPSPALTDGNYQWSASQVDLAGNESPASTPIDFTVDTSGNTVSIDYAADNVGSITDNLTSGSVTDDATPTLHGSAVANATVYIYQDGVKIGEATADRNGNWSYDVPALAEGQYNFQASVLDAGNVEGPKTQNFALEIDLTAPNKPAIDDVADDVGAQQGTIANGGYTDDTTPTLTGKGTPGETVTIRNGDDPLGQVQVRPDGTWSWTPAGSPLNDGTYNFTVTLTDKAGNESVRSDEWVVNIDTQAPVAPVITSVMDDQGSTTGPIANGGTTDDTQPEIRGTAEKGSTVIIYDNGVEIGRVDADVTTGEWSFTPNTALSGDAHSLTAVATDKAGNVSAPSNNWDFTLDTGAVQAPVIVDAWDDTAPQTGVVNDGEFTNDTTPTLRGTGQAGNTIHLYDQNGNKLGEATVQGDGSWSFDLPVQTEGFHSFTAIAENAAGNLSVPSAEFGLNIDTTAPGKPGDNNDGIGQVWDDVAPGVGDIPQGGVTNDNQPTLSGSNQQPGSSVEVIADGVALGTAIVNPNGGWEFTPTNPLPDGDHEFTIIVTDPAGNVSPESDPYPIIVDTLKPDAPVITLVDDDQGALRGDIPNGAITDDNRPVVSGTAEKGSLVLLYDNGGTTPIGSAVADPITGNWTINLNTALLNGPHSLTAVARDAAQNLSDPSDARDFSVLAGGTPTAPAINNVFDDNGAGDVALQPGGLTDDNTPRLEGTALPGVTVTIWGTGPNGRVSLGTVDADGAGRWTFTPTALADGRWSFVAEAQDPTGNPLQSGPWVVNVDATAPAAPVIVEVIDDVGSQTGPINNGDTTDDARPEIKGTAEAGSTVIIYDNGREIGRVQADGTTGEWTYTPNLTLGDHSITVQAQDAAGNLSPMSDEFVLTVASVGTSGREDFLQGTLYHNVGYEYASGLKVVAKSGNAPSWSSNGMSWSGAYRLGSGDSSGSGNTITTRNTLTVGPTTKVSMDLYAGKNLHAAGAESGDYASVTVRVYDTNGVLLDTFSLTTPANLERIQYTYSYEAPAGTLIGNIDFTSSTKSSNGGTSMSNLAWGDGVVVPPLADTSGSYDFSLLSSFTLNAGYEIAKGLKFISSSTGTTLRGNANGIGIDNGTYTMSLEATTAVQFKVTTAQSNIEVRVYDTDGNLLDTSNINVNEVRTYQFEAPAGKLIGNIEFVGFSTGQTAYVDDWFWGDAVDSNIVVNSEDENAVQSDVFGIDLDDADTLDDSASVTGGILQVEHADQPIDLSNLAEAQQFNTVDLNNGGNDVLNVTLGDLLVHAEKDAFIADGNKQLMIQGDEGDVVNLSDLLPDGTDPGNWAKAEGTVTVSGVQYEVFQHSAMETELLVQQGVQTNLNNH